MNLISLSTFEKLINLEMLALFEITEKQWEVYGNEWDDMWSLIHAYLTKHELFQATEFFVFYPCTPLVASPSSPNRFVKSSFALSLLWIGCFYREICLSYKEVGTEWAAAWHCAKRAFTGYKRSLA